MSERTHHPVSPSRLARVEQCPGSVQMEDGLPDVAGEAAERGRLLHERVVSGDVAGLEPAEVEAVETCRAMVADAVAGGWQVEHEVRLSLSGSGGAVLSYGYADALATSADGAAARVYDWKFGRGAVDAPTANLQTGCYAIMALQRAPAVLRVDCWIVQPFVGPPVCAGFTRAEARQLVPRLLSIFAAATAPAMTLRAGSECTYCRARALCPALARAGDALVKAPAADLQDPARLSALLDAWHAAKTRGYEVERLARAAALANGGALGDWRLKDGAKRRTIPDAQKAFEAVQDVLPVAAMLALVDVPPGQFEIAFAAAWKLQEPAGEKRTLVAGKREFERRLKGLIQVTQNAPTLVRKSE